MKTKRLDGRYSACKQWGYTWQVEFRGFDWKKFYAFKAQAKSMFEDSVNISKPFLWRDEASVLKFAPWASSFVKSSKPMFVYFRTEDQMNQCIMMFALTGQI